MMDALYYKLLAANPPRKSHSSTSSLTHHHMQILNKHVALVRVDASGQDRWISDLHSRSMLINGKKLPHSPRIDSWKKQ